MGTGEEVMPTRFLLRPSINTKKKGMSIEIYFEEFGRFRVLLNEPQAGQTYII